MSLPHDLVRAVRRLDEHQLRRLAILVVGLLQTSEGPAVSTDDVPGLGAVRYRQEHVRCGRDCGACPHGPYWYAYWTEAGRRRSLYVGAELPAQIARKLAQEDAACVGTSPL